MESRARALGPADSRAPARRRWGTGIARTALGLAVLGALVFWGQIDLRALLALSAAPWAIVACIALLLLTLPVAAIRWGILLRALGASIPFLNLLHFVAIGVLTNVLLLGGTGGDAIRGI